MSDEDRRGHNQPVSFLNLYPKFNVGVFETSYMNFLAPCHCSRRNKIKQNKTKKPEAFKH